MHFMKIDLFYASGVALLFAGWVFALLPHALHGQVGLKDQPHSWHVVLGLVLVGLGIGVLVWQSRRGKAAGKPVPGS